MFVAGELQEEIGISLYPGHFPPAKDVKIIVESIFPLSFAGIVVRFVPDLFLHAFQEGHPTAVQHQVEGGCRLVVNRLEPTGKLIDHFGTIDRIQYGQILYLPGLNYKFSPIRPLVVDTLLLQIEFQRDVRKEPVIGKANPSQLPIGEEQGGALCLYSRVYDRMAVHIIQIHLTTIARIEVRRLLTLSRTGDRLQQEGTCKVNDQRRRPSGSGT